MELQHLSYSGLHTYETCPEQYRLLKKEQLPDVPGWYHAGGSAVHNMIEDWNLDQMGVTTETTGWSWLQHWEQMVENQTEQEPDKTKWKIGGKGKDDETWWRQNGEGMVNRWKNWYRNSPYTIWITPDGEPAIELEVAPKIGEVQGKGFIDVVLEHVSGQLGVVDFKTGKPPEDHLQLGGYAHAVQQRWPEVEVTHGGYFMARGGILTGWHDLRPVMGLPLAHRYTQAAKAIEHDIFPPRPSGLCAKWCSVNYACVSHSPNSPETALYAPWRDQN